MTIEPTPLVLEAIGLGLFVSLVFSETLGVATGGMIVPGYVALALDQPLRIVTTLAVALLTYLTMRLVSTQVLLYGRRRTVLVLLLGFLLGSLSRYVLPTHLGAAPVEIEAIGFLIPGLIADWMERQGTVETLCALVPAAVLVRCCLIVGHNGFLR